MEENISNYQGINWVNIKNNKIGHSLTVSVETMAFLMVTSVPLVNNSTNFINPTSPKQQIIKNIRGRSDVSMSNNKNTSTQEVRQKDIDDAQAIEDVKINELNKRLDKLENNLIMHIDKTKKDLDNSITEAETRLNERIDRIIDENDKNFDRKMRWLTLFIAILQLILYLLLRK